MGSRNKGDWSEFYVFLKVLTDRKLFPADPDFNPILKLATPVLKVFRNESGKLETEYDLSRRDDEIIFSSPKLAKALILDSVKISSKLKTIFSKIVAGGEKQRVDIPEGDELMNYLRCTGPHAMQSKLKEDLSLVLHDPRSGQTPRMAYSIKSQVGAPSTLLNASGATNFKFEFSAPQMNVPELNSEGTARKRIDAALANGRLKFVGVYNKIFEHNLELIDTVFPELMSFLLFIHFSTDKSNIFDIFNELGDELPIVLPSGRKMRKDSAVYIFKRFLVAVALGMTPSRQWDGKSTATGGYLVLKSNGDVVCYHIFNIDEFQEYLFKSTKFERGSESKHQYGKFYSENGKCFINLNLQIRFTR